MDPGQRITELVFVHGAGSSADFWQGQRAAFQDAHYVNLLGHGDALDQDLSHEASAPSISQYGDGLIANIEEQGLQNVVLNGHSMGGAVVLEVALRHPGWLRGLVLTCSGSRFKVSSNLLELLRSDFRAGVDFILEHSFSTPEGELSYRQRAVRYGTMRQMLRVPQAVVLGDYEACKAFDVSKRLAQIGVPTLIIAGQSDRMTALERSEELHAGIRGSHMVVIEGAGHMAPLEKPEDYNKVVSEFVARLKA